MAVDTSSLEIRMAQRLKVGIVGCGIGREHAAAYHALPKQFELVAICDVDEAKARQVAATYGVAHSTDFEALCRMDSLDVIDICTPPSLHLTQSLAALAAQKHVIC